MNKNILNFFLAKTKSIHYKIALAVAILRNKPDNLSAKQFTQLIQLSFRESYNKNKEIIAQLKDSLLKCKQENYLLKNKSSFEDFDTPASSLIATTAENSHLNFSRLKNPEHNKTFVNINQYAQMKENYERNMEFLTNLVKLKIIGKNFQLDEKVETIIETLKQFLQQIKYFFFFNYEKVSEENELACQSQSQADSAISISYSSYLESTLDDTGNSFVQSQLKEKESNLKIFYSFPFDSLVHALQIFLNIFQIEWLYYLRSNLLELLNDFIDDLVKFILECDEISKVS